MGTQERIHEAGHALAAGLVFLAMLVAAFSLWTAIPLSWVYIASKLSETQFPSGGPYAVVAIGIVASILFVAWLIGRLNNLYIRITGTNRLAPIRPTWLKSMRDTGAGLEFGDGGRGGADGLGDAGRSGSHPLVLPPRRLALAGPVTLPALKFLSFADQKLHLAW